jgi:hypothetical protein
MGKRFEHFLEEKKKNEKKKKFRSPLFLHTTSFEGAQDG